MRGIVMSLILGLSLYGGEYYYVNGDKRVELTPITQTRGSGGEEKGTQTLRFRDPSGRELTIGNRLLVRFKDPQNLREYLNRFDLRIVKKYRLGAMYLLEASDPESAMEAANALAEMPDVDFAQPDVGRKRRLR